jgi:hypothetical protein
MRVFLIATVKIADGRMVMAPIDPLILKPKLAFCQIRIFFDVIGQVFHRGNAYAI